MIITSSYLKHFAIGSFTQCCNFFKFTKVTGCLCLEKTIFGSRIDKYISVILNVNVLHTTIQKFWVSKTFIQHIYTCIKLIKSDSKNIYDVTNYNFYFK